MYRISTRALKAPRSLIPVVAGSSFLWAWGFLCYLSPVMFLANSSSESSVGIEYGFFVSQISAVLFASLLLIVLRKKSVVIPRKIFLAASIIVTASSIGLATSAEYSYMAGFILCGVLDGISVTIMGIAWGTRYSLGSSRMHSLVMLSFLVAYLIYLIVSVIPAPFSLVLTCILPMASWGLWWHDALSRHEIAPETVPIRNTTSDDFPLFDELIIGSWKASELPWKPLSILLATSFVGNAVSSSVMGNTYLDADSLFRGGIFVCACITTMTLVPLTSSREPLSIQSMYLISLAFTVIGLTNILVLEQAGIPLGGALAQGSAYFLQPLIILIVTQNTQKNGLAPLLSFGIGQAAIAGVVVSGNLAGKLANWLCPSHEFAINVVCGLGIVWLFFLLAIRTKSLEEETADVDEDERAILAQPSDKNEEAPPSPESISADDDELRTSVDDSERLDLFTKSFNLTKREIEIFEYLTKGRSLPYIADKLFVTTGTIKTHTMHIYRKLQVNSRQDLLDMYEKWTPKDENQA